MAMDYNMFFGSSKAGLGEGARKGWRWELGKYRLIVDSPPASPSVGRTRSMQIPHSTSLQNGQLTCVACIFGVSQSSESVWVHGIASSAIQAKGLRAAWHGSEKEGVG